MAKSIARTDSVAPPSPSSVAPVVTDGEEVEESIPNTEPAPSHTLPAGVSMHQAGVLPNTIDRVNRITHDPRMPPPNWNGPVVRCGGCGDFLGDADRCSKCTPANVQPNVMNHPVKA